MGRSEEVYAILCDVYGQSPWTLSQVEADLALETTHYAFVVDGAEVVGFLALQDLGAEAEITQIAVKKAYQGKGYGGQLLAQLDQLAVDIFLEVRASNVPAISLYEKYGFVAVGQRKNYYHDPVEDALVMKRGRDDR